jgi:hypothetical protein
VANFSILLGIEKAEGQVYLCPRAAGLQMLSELMQDKVAFAGKPCIEGD